MRPLLLLLVAVLTAYAAGCKTPPVDSEAGRFWSTAAIPAPSIAHTTGVTAPTPRLSTPTPGSGAASVRHDGAPAINSDPGASGSARPGAEPEPAPSSPATPSPSGTKPTPDVGQVPPIPARRTATRLLADSDSTYAIVNGEVITTKDLEADIPRFFNPNLDLLAAEDTLAAYDVLRREMEAARYRRDRAQLLKAAFRLRLLTVVYRQRGAELRKKYGSLVTAARIDQQIEQYRRAQKTSGSKAKVERAWEQLLASKGLTYLTLREQIRDQLERGIVLQIIAQEERQGPGAGLDPTPEDLRREYVARPIQRTTDIQILRVDMPLRNTAELHDVRVRATRFRRLIGQHLQDAVPERRAEAFLKVLALYHTRVGATFERSPVMIANAGDVETEVAIEIRKTEPGELSDVIELHNKVSFFFLISKRQDRYEPYARRAVQEELRTRLVNRRWNTLTGKIDRELIESATVVPPDLKRALLQAAP